MQFAPRLLAAAAVCYGSLALTVTALQRKLIYFPATAPARQLVALAERLGLDPWEIDGEIIAWRTPTDRHTRKRLLVFHGNAGFALDRSYFLGLPPDSNSWQVILAEYPGYGSRSSREPSERSFQDTAKTLLDHLRAESDHPVFAVGESIGTGVATWLAGTHHGGIAGLVLITPMPSLADVASHHYPWLPVQSFLRDRYDAVAALREYHGPVAFVLAEDDQIVPPALGIKLYETYSGPKRLWIQEGADHNTLDYDPGRWAEVFAFIDQGGAR
jgi:pimeloyl-ACP methyl ester carboxylesterase